MQNIKIHLKDLSLITSIIIIGLFYRVFNHGGEEVYSLVTTIDQQIPLVKIFAIPYLGWYAFIILTLVYLCFKDKRIYYKTLITYNITILLCYLVYAYFQTTVARPEIVGSDIFSSLVAFIYNSDEPFNCFPSIHCMTCFLMIIAVKHSKKVSKYVSLGVTASAVIIILSTLLVKQHVIMDVIAAYFLSNIVFNFVYNVKSEKFISFIQNPQYVFNTRKLSSFVDLLTSVVKM